MKKAFITLCVIAVTAMSVFAAEGNEKPRYATPKFTQGWFIDLAGTYSIFASTGSAYHQMSTYYGGFNTNNPRHLLGVSGKIGRRVSPSVAIRVGYDWHPSYNATDNFNFKSLHFDFMESPLDLFFGYNPDRLYTMWVYGGVGLLACDKFPAGQINQGNYRYLIHWNSALELGVHGGIMNNFRLSDALDLHIDLTAVATRWTFDADHPDTYSLWHRAHFDFSGMVGLMWYLGGRTLDVIECGEAADCSKQEARINELIDQVNGLQAQLANCSDGGITVHDTVYETITVNGEVITYPFSVFFNKGSYELRDGRDRINLQEIAQAAIDHNLIVNLKGTCDAATASAAFNKTLAENRCNKVKAELVKIGVPSDNIVIDAVGGVTDLKPAEYDRRVIVTFSEKK